MKTNNRLVLPLIIILLIISLPFTAIGLGNKIYITIKGDNPEHLHKIDNKLYYYNSINKLIGTYDCQNPNCDSAYQKIDDNELINYHKNLSYEPMGVFSNEYIFVQDGDELVLYNLKSHILIGKFKSFKNYGTNISDKYIILQYEDGKYGLFDIENVIYALQSKYLYIGVSNNMINESSENLKLLASETEGTYSVISIEGEILYSISGETIVDYNNDYVYTLKDELYHIYNYNNDKLLKDTKISKYDIYNDYMIITSKNGDISVYPYDLSQEAIKTFKNKDKNIHYSIENDILTIKDKDDNEIDTYSFATVDEINEETEEESNEEVIEEETLEEE